MQSWVGAELGFIAQAYTAAKLTGKHPFLILCKSLPYRFLPFMYLLLAGTTVLTEREIGELRRVEQRFKHTSPDEEQEQEQEQEQGNDSTQPAEGSPRRSVNAALPMLGLVLGAVVGMVVTGIDGCDSHVDPVSQEHAPLPHTLVTIPRYCYHWMCCG